MGKDAADKFKGAPRGACEGGGRREGRRWENTVGISQNIQTHLDRVGPAVARPSLLTSRRESGFGLGPADSSTPRDTPPPRFRLISDSPSPLPHPRIHPPCRCFLPY